MMSNSRFDRALSALYQGFYTGNLYPEDACRCAVGTLCDGWSAWKHFSDDHGSLRLNYVGRVHELLGRRYFGYLPSELLKIEAAFLKGCGYQLPLHHRSYRPDVQNTPDSLFNGLLMALRLLADLEGINDIIPHTKRLEELAMAKKSELISA